MTSSEFGKPREESSTEVGDFFYDSNILTHTVAHYSNPTPPHCLLKMKSGVITFHLRRRPPFTATVAAAKKEQFISGGSLLL